VSFSHFFYLIFIVVALSSKFHQTIQFQTLYYFISMITDTKDIYKRVKIEDKQIKTQQKKLKL